MWWTNTSGPPYDVCVNPETLALVALGLGASSILANAALAYLFFTRSAPAVLHSMATTAINAGSRCELRVDQIEMRQAGWKAELDSYFETVEDMLARVEKKRKSAQSTENRTRQRELGELQDTPPTRAEQIAAGRERLRLAGG